MDVAKILPLCEYKESISLCCLASMKLKLLFLYFFWVSFHSKEDRVKVTAGLVRFASDSVLCSMFSGEVSKTLQPALKLAN